MQTHTSRQEIEFYSLLFKFESAQNSWFKVLLGVVLSFGWRSELEWTALRKGFPVSDLTILSFMGPM